MTTYLDREDVLTAGSVALDVALRVSDYGLLDSAVARPGATVFGVDAYPDLFTKAAALLQSLARNHAFVDGNKRTAWAATWTFLGVNDVELAARFDVDAAEEFVLDVATGAEATIGAIAEDLARFATWELPGR
jgi:death-on-curing protein